MLRNRYYRLKASHRLCCIAVLIMLAVPLAISAQPKAADQPPSASDTVTAKQGLYDINATGTDIKLILEALAQRSGANIVVSPDITGDITAHLKQQTVEDIMNFLSTVQGFGWRKDGETYLVAGKDKLAQTGDDSLKPPEPETLIWRCRHLRAADLVTVIGKLYPQLKLAEGPGQSQPKLDTNQDSSISYNGSQSSSSSSSSPSTNNEPSTLVIIGSTEMLDKAKALLEKLDARPPQVSIDVAITEISSGASKDLGIDWSWSDLNLSENNPGGINFGKFNKDGMSFTGTIKAMLLNNSAKLLAQPNLSVMDGANAEILIGDRIMFPKLVGYNQVGAPIYDKDEERVGISLQLAVRITDQDDVIMTIYPQVSLVTKYLVTQAGSYPQISTREARTTVAVRNGTTLAIGGLIKDNEITDGASIPLLSKLPIIGGLFRRSSRTKEHTELVLFLTPRIVKQD